MQLVKRPFFLLSILFFLPELKVFGQTTIVTDSVFIPGTTVVIPGKHYKRSGFHNLWWGSHYRNVWSTPVRVSNVQLDTIAGGLIATEESGSRQTMGLRLKNPEGKEYVLRSIDKDFGRGLGELFEGTFVANVAKDQSSIGHPYAAITIAPMIGATGIYHTNPRIYFVQRQKALGSFNEKYGDQLYLLEERPDENWENAAHFGFSRNLIGTPRLFEKIYGDNDNQVDQVVFARARLFDMFIGDWSRHADQWRWAEFEEGNKNYYKAVPRDRDQAYTTFDGFFPWIASSVAGARFLESFDSDLSNVKDFNQPARILDKKFLNEVTKEQWIQQATQLKAALTDSVIEYGVWQMPAEAFAISGKLIIDKLKSRRDQLESYASEYYEYLAQRVDITGSQKRELFDINRINDDSTEINIYKITKENEVKSEPLYSRIFRETETKEIRLYGLESEDSFIVRGQKNKGVKVRIIDPEGIDIIDPVKDRRLKVSSGRRFEYDTAHQKKLDFFFLPFLSPPECELFDEHPLALFTRTGLKISANVRIHPMPWQREEYEDWHLLTANYGFLRKTFFLAYVGTYKNIIHNWDLSFAARLDAPAVENYYGIGNETFNAKLSSSVYNTNSNRIFVSPGLAKKIGKAHLLSFNLFYQRIKVKNNEHPFSIIPVNPRVFSPQQFGGVAATYNLRLVNNTIYPTKGIDFLTSAGYVKNVSGDDRAFLKASSSLSVYVPLGNSFTLAVRAGGGIIDGDADYYHLHTLGGNENLRGYQRERFYANNIFYNNNEIRWLVDTRNIIYNGKIGLLAFFDNGRAWHSGESSDKWHTSYGAGLIVVPFDKILLAGTYGIGNEGRDILLRASLFF